MRYHPLFFLFLLGCALITACAPSRIVKPLPAQTKSVGFNAGGALIGFAGTTIPIPLTGVTGAYGVKDDLTAFASLHPTALAYGVIQTDMGVVKGLMEPKGWQPGLSVSPTANLIIDRWEGHFKFYPQVDVNAYWHYGQKPHFIYTGISNWFELSSKRVHDQPQPRFWLPQIQLGHDLAIKQTDLVFEMKYLAPFSSNKNVVVDYKTPFSTGAIGVYFSINKKF